MEKAFRVKRAALDYRSPPGPTAQRLRRIRRRWGGVIASFAALAFLLFVVGFGVVLFTLPALPLVVDRPAAKVADDRPESSQRIYEPDKLKGVDK